MPLSSKGLCEAESTMPPWASSAPGEERDPGRGQHADRVAVGARRRAGPATIAASSSGPERRVSRPMTTRTPFLPCSGGQGRGQLAARRGYARSGVSGGSLATPRMPSVPKSRLTEADFQTSDRPSCPPVEYPR